MPDATENMVVTPEVAGILDDFSSMPLQQLVEKYTYQEIVDLEEILNNISSSTARLSSSLYDQLCTALTKSTAASSKCQGFVTLF